MCIGKEEKSVSVIKQGNVKRVGMQTVNVTYQYTRLHNPQHQVIMGLVVIIVNRHDLGKYCVRRDKAPAP